MCERTYSGCSNCGATAENLCYWADESYRSFSRIDEDGHPVDHFDSGDPETSDSGYECAVCESSDVGFDTELSPDECDCRECDPVSYIEDPDDPDELILLHRIWGHPGQRPNDLDCAPPEIQKLYSDRALLYLPVRAERLAEFVHHCDEYGCTPEPATTVPDRLKALMVPEPDDSLEEANA